MLQWLSKGPNGMGNELLTEKPVEEEKSLVAKELNYHIAGEQRERGGKSCFKPERKGEPLWNPEYFWESHGSEWRAVGTQHSEEANKNKSLTRFWKVSINFWDLKKKKKIRENIPNIKKVTPSLKSKVSSGHAVAQFVLVSEEGHGAHVRLDVDWLLQDQDSVGFPRNRLSDVGSLSCILEPLGKSLYLRKDQKCQHRESLALWQRKQHFKSIQWSKTTSLDWSTIMILNASNDVCMHCEVVKCWRFWWAKTRTFMYSSMQKRLKLLCNNRFGYE